MKTSAMPAAESLEHNASVAPPYIRLVTSIDNPEARVVNDGRSAEPLSAEDPDEMWDNLPV